jgi:hypothetical protein
MVALVGLNEAGERSPVDPHVARPETREGMR